LDKNPRREAATLKRLIDLLGAAVSLILFTPLMATIALVVLLSDGQPLLYKEYRVGRYGRTFRILKIRTLRQGSPVLPSVAPEDDLRITPFGRWLRRWRLDEFPQFYNVLRGDMSLVGPRPMPPLHARQLTAEQRNTVHSMRPGITDPAAIHFLAEDAVLAGREDAEAIYLQLFLPVKAQMQIDYIKNWTLLSDLQVLVRTMALLWSKSAREKSAGALRDLLVE
jgi:lipopolysaccharide/colanic/teichoic acid biosynthesis glycosyltransferase